MSIRNTLTISFFLFTLTSQGQIVFKKSFTQEDRCRTFHNLCSDTDKMNKRLYFKLSIKNNPIDTIKCNDNDPRPCFQDWNYSHLLEKSVRNSIGIINVISDLLSFEGDTDLCFIPVGRHAFYYEKERKKGDGSVIGCNSLYSGNFQNYSIQVEALFMINWLYFQAPCIYSEFPVLTHSETGEAETIDGKIVKMAYQSYKQWFEKVKEIGTEEAKKQKLHPLVGSLIRWEGKSVNGLGFGHLDR